MNIQKSTALYHITELALSESARRLSALSDLDIEIVVDEVARYCGENLDKIQSPYESTLVAVCQRLEGARPTGILFMLPEGTALRFTRLILGQHDRLSRMTEMEEEVLTEVGNIIINSCLRQYIGFSDEPLSAMIPFLSRGKFKPLSELLNLTKGSVAPDSYLLKTQLVIGGHCFDGYIQWLGQLCQLDGAVTSSDPLILTSVQGGS